MKKLGKRTYLAALCSLTMLLGGLFAACSSGDSGGGGNEPEEKKEEINTSALYRLGAASDCDFVDGKLTAFDGDGSLVNYNDNTLKTYMLYYPTIVL